MADGRAGDTGEPSQLPAAIPCPANTRVPATFSPHRWREGSKFPPGAREKLVTTFWEQQIGRSGIPPRAGPCAWPLSQVMEGRRPGAPIASRTRPRCRLQQEMCRGESYRQPRCELVWSGTAAETDSERSRCQGQLVAEPGTGCPARPRSRVRALAAQGWGEQHRNNRAGKAQTGQESVWAVMSDCCRAEDRATDRFPQGHRTPSWFGLVVAARTGQSVLALPFCLVSVRGWREP